MKSPGASGFPHRPNKGATDSWLTPPKMIEAVGPFDLDPCAAGGEYAWRPWETAPASYTQDGLNRPWFGMVWLNPPFGSETGVWLDRLADYGRGVGLTFARTDTDWFRRAAWERAGGYLFLYGRPRFWTPGGYEAEMNCGAPIVMSGYGDEALRRLARQDRKLGHFMVNAFALLVSPGERPVGTWREALEIAAGGRTLHLRDIYAAAEGTAKVREAKACGHNWRAQIRRALQVNFAAVERGVWRAA